MVRYEWNIKLFKKHYQVAPKKYLIKSFNFAKSNFKSYIMNIIHSMHGCFSVIILDLKKKSFWLSCYCDAKVTTNPSLLANRTNKKREGGCSLSVCLSFFNIAHLTFSDLT